MRPRIPLSLEAALTAAAWVVLVLGLSVLALTVPVFTASLVRALDVPTTAGLPPADALALADRVRALVADPFYEPLPATLDGSPAFDGAAVSHLLDVRAVLAGARIATGALALALAAYVGLAVARRRFAPLRAGMRAGAWAMAALLAIAASTALLDFESFFAQFHGLFFADGTWTFPADSLLIRLFPERFWIAAGASWGVLAALGAVVLAAAARYLRGEPADKDASRMRRTV